MNSQTQQKIAIVGATSAIAEHCARLWLAAGGVAELVLIGRDEGRLQALAGDLRIRGPGAEVVCVAGDLGSTEGIASLVERACAGRAPDVVLVAHGSLPDQAQCQGDLVQAREALEVNGVSPALFAEAFVARMQQGGGGVLGLIGSVAGDRGRKSNYVYGSAKGLLARYAQGLQHRLAGSAVAVCLIKPGPTDTPMTAALKSRGAKLASVEAVAADIVAGMARRRPVIYTPGKWALIMLVIRHLPRFVFNRMDI